MAVPVNICDNLIERIKTLTEPKLYQVMGYIDALDDEDDFTEEEIKEILAASKRVAEGEYVEWKPGMFTE